MNKKPRQRPAPFGALIEGIEAVKAGRDPKGVIRDPEKNKLIVIGGNYRWIDEDEREEMLAAIVA